MATRKKATKKTTDDKDCSADNATPTVSGISAPATEHHKADDIIPEDAIYIKGARMHNLKNVDVAIPRNKLVVVTGVSGSRQIVADHGYSVCRRTKALCRKPQRLCTPVPDAYGQARCGLHTRYLPGYSYRTKSNYAHAPQYCGQHDGNI
jgi:hypothetical protein